MSRLASPAGVLAADAPGAASVLATPRSENGAATPDATPPGLGRVSPYARPRTPGSGRAASPADDVRSVGSAGSGGSARGGGGLHASAGASSLLDAQLAALPPPESEEEATHAVPSLLSQLMTGRPEEQGAAAARLLSYVQHVGPPVRGALRAAGGLHMLLIMLDSLDRGVREACIRLLADLAADPRVRREVASAPGGLAKTIALMFRGLADGVPAAAAFLQLLAAGEGEGQEVRAACARARVVHVLTRAAGAGTAGAARARGAVLSALEAFCAADGANVRKMGWAGGVEVLLGLLAAGGAPEHHLPALRLLGRAAEALPEAAPAACTAAGVAALAEFVGSPAAPLEAQALAARVLARVAAVPVRKEDATQALTDLALPRAFEVLHEAAAAAGAAGGGDGEAEGGQQPAPQQREEEAQRRALVGACAACTAHLVAACADCCHALLHHSALLRPALDALLASRQFGLAQKLLEASAAYARRRRGPEVLLGSTGGAGVGAAVAVATA